MKLTIKTITLQEMVVRAVKGASNNKLIPLTSLMAIELKKNKLTLTTTDATNYLYIIEDNVQGDDFYVVVEVDKFSKLIARMTCDTITMKLTKNVLNVVGNGTYNIDIVLDEDGSVIEFPNKLNGLPKDFKKKKKTYDVNMATILTILNSVKPSIDVMEGANTVSGNICYTGYYVADKVVATNTMKMTCMNVEVFDEARLISPEMMNLLAVMMAEKIKVETYNDVVIFSTSDCVVYGTIMEGIEDYAIDDIMGLIETDFKFMCVMPKAPLMQLLSRLSLFVGDYDNNAITMTFAKDGLQISSQSSNGVEIIEYKDSKKFKAFTCKIDINMLFVQLKALEADTVELWYGLDNAIKLVDGSVTHILSLAFDDIQQEDE